MYAKTTSAVHDLGLLLIRVMVGVVFMFHGSQKLFGWFEGAGMEGFTGMLEGLEIPMPQVAAYLSALTEFVGGLLLLVGFLTRLAAIPVVFNMLVASIVVHGHAFSLQKQGMEYALTLAVVVTGIALTGAGRFSLDACIWREKSPPPSDG